MEFQKIIPMLTTPRPDRDFVFEVVIPSLPGFTFSQAAVRTGLGPPQVKFIRKCLTVSSRSYSRHYTRNTRITVSLTVLLTE